MAKQIHTTTDFSRNRLFFVFTTIIGFFERFPLGLIAFIGRFSIAAVFWKSGQTKIEGFAVDIVEGTFQLGWPRLADSAVALFQEEYKLPLLSPEVAAYMGATVEHLLPILLLVGLGTRFAAIGLLGMTCVIQFWVYPDAYPIHGTWISILLFLVAKGPGPLSLDYFIARHFSAASPGTSKISSPFTTA